MLAELMDSIDQSWTLFLDRDGVINVRIENDYVKTPDEFIFLPGAKEAIVRLSKAFGRIVVVTNQQGIGKGLYTSDDLSLIHNKMLGEIQLAGGKIDAVYFAPQLQSENSPMRKPGIGMALAAAEKYPEINFSRCIMVGDTASDMEFARNAGMRAVLCTPIKTDVPCDMHCCSLQEFALYIPTVK